MQHAAGLDVYSIVLMSVTVLIGLLSAYWLIGRSQALQDHVEFHRGGVPLNCPRNPFESTVVDMIVSGALFTAASLCHITLHSMFADGIRLVDGVWAIAAAQFIAQSLLMADMLYLRRRARRNLLKS